MASEHTRERKRSESRVAPAGFKPVLDDMADSQSMTGSIFVEMCRAGCTYLISNKSELNRINVFPIPDADTGNNMKAGASPSLPSPLCNALSLTSPLASPGRLIHAVLLAVFV